MEPVLWFFKSTGQGWELFVWFLENYYWSSSPKIKEIVFTQPYRFGSVYEKRERIARQWWIPFLTHHVDVLFKSPITTVNECQRVSITWVWLVALNAMFVCNKKDNPDMDLSKDDFLFRIPGSILFGTCYYTNVKPYFILEWLKPLSLPHACHKPRSYCWRQNHILLYCNKHVHKYSQNHGTMQVWANQKKSFGF